ncbi:MAG: hypothetical protein ACUVQH_01470 [Thermogutta sp.]
MSEQIASNQPSFSSNSVGFPAPGEQPPVFVERRKDRGKSPPSGGERRQFGNSYADLSPEAQELGQAVDAYKLQHHRRFINYEELLTVIKSLGYHK